MCTGCSANWSNTRSRPPSNLRYTIHKPKRSHQRTGPGGTGKTCLLIEWTEQLRKMGMWQLAFSRRSIQTKSVVPFDDYRTHRDRSRLHRNTPPREKDPHDATWEPNRTCAGGLRSGAREEASKGGERSAQIAMNVDFLKAKTTGRLLSLLLPLSAPILPQSAIAMCLSEAVSVWPKNGRLPANGVIVVTGYGTAQSLIRNLEKQSPHLVIRLPSLEALDVAPGDLADHTARPFATEDITVEVHGDDREGLLAPLLPEFSFLLLRLVDLLIDPRAQERGPRAAQDDLVPDAHAPIDRIGDVVPREDVLLVEPHPNAHRLEVIVEPPGERFVLPAVRDEAGVKVDRAHALENRGR